MVGVDRRFPFFGRGKDSLRRAVVAAAAVVLALAALGFLIWALVTGSAIRLAWLVAMATILAAVLPAWAMSAQMLAWVRRHRPAADRVPQLRSLAGLDPFDLGVHRPVEAGTAGPLPDLPQYVPRNHDTRLRQVAGEAAGGVSRLLVVVGGSSTGKTRACWQMLASLPGRVPRWLLWQPIYPTRPDAVLAGLGQIGPRTVVWLDEAQLYLDTPDDTGERVAAGLRELLRDPGRRPVLVVATLWPAHWDTLTTRADPDRHAQARELLSGHNIDVPECFSAAALSKLAEEAGTDPRLAEAAAQAADGQITQYLAGAPVLLDRYQQAPPGARALIWAAMDARRLGCGLHLPLALLEAAAPGYLTDQEWDQLDDGWLDQAMAYATRPCNGIPGPLTRIRPRNPGPHHAGGAAGTGHDGTPLYRLADYLDQHGRRHRHALIPPPSFWAAAPCAQPADLTTLAAAARARGLYRNAAQLLKSTAARGDPHASADLIDILHDLHPGDHRPAQWITAHVALDLGSPGGVAYLLGWLREAGAQDQVTALLARDPAAHVDLGDPAAVARLLRTLRAAGAQDQVTALADRAAALAAVGDPVRVAMLLYGLRRAGAQDQVTALADRAAALAAVGDPVRVAMLLYGLRRAGAQDQVTALADRAAALPPLGDPAAVASLLDSLREAGAQDQVTALLARDPAAHVDLGDPAAVASLLDSLREAGAQDQVTALLARDPAAHVDLGDPAAVASLLDSLREAGAQDQVTALADRAAALPPLDDPAAASITGALEKLLDSLRRAGAEKQATLLVDRLPGEGLFNLFCAQGNHQALYRFGRNPDGSPAEPWDWDDLN